MVFGLKTAAPLWTAASALGTSAAAKRASLRRRTVAFILFTSTETRRSRGRAVTRSEDAVADDGLALDPRRLAIGGRVAERGVLLQAPALLPGVHDIARRRSEENTSELQSLMRSSYAVFSL